MPRLRNQSRILRTRHRYVVTEMGDTVVIEFEDEGTITDRPYRNRIANSFDVRGSHIAGFREYFGDIDPNFITALSDGASASPKA